MAKKKTPTEPTVERTKEIVISVRKSGAGLGASVVRGKDVFRPSGQLPRFEQEDAAALRWLLEDGPRLSSEATKTAAIAAEARVNYFGDQLFDSLQEALKSALNGRPIDEFALSIRDPKGFTRHWPWEILSWDQAPVVLACRSFTRRVGHGPSRLSSTHRTKPLRLLIVAARPREPADIRFRSIASRVLEATSEESIRVELLRPPTFKALGEHLLAAKSAGTPYDILHFDGHGDLVKTSKGPTGVLFFEDESATGYETVDGSQMGALLAKGDVPLLILNACHSGSAPLRWPSLSRPTRAATTASASLAERVASSAAIDVVAMSHAVYVSTAALIVQDLYRCLDRGHSVATAVTFARRRWQQAYVERSSSLGFSLILHFGCPADSAILADWPDYGEPARSDDRTPPHPRMQAAFRSDAPFIAADTQILLLERALRRTPIVQLNGLRGSGKTSLMLELGRWLAASKADDPERIVYLDFGAARSAVEAIESVALANAGILLIDHAECVEGDALRRVAPWANHDRDDFVRCLHEKSKNRVQILIAASGRISALGHTECLVMPRLEDEDIRKLVELNTDRGTAARVPEPAILWTAGNPGVVPILVDLQGTGAFADAAPTLEALSELRFGRFSKTKPPMQQILPLQLQGGAALFELDVGMPWLLMQFQGQALLSPILWKLADASGLSILAQGESRVSLEGILQNLERSGLVSPFGAEGFLIHPLFACVMAHPYNKRELATDGYLRSLNLVQGLYSQYVQFLAASPFMGDEQLAFNTEGWNLHNLLHAFSCFTGELIDHMGALSLARRLRTSFLAMDCPEYWSNVLQKLKEIFERYPPPDDGLFNPRTEMNLLLMEEASSKGDDLAAADLAKKAAEAARPMPGPGEGHLQTSAYDVQLKTGRLLANTDMKAALKCFNAALESAGQDPLRKATVQFELTGLLRRFGTPSDLLAARVHGENALSLFLYLVQVKVCEPEMIVLITMSLSLVYKDLLGTPATDPMWATRGEELCRASLRLAEEPIHKATAWFNLGGWLYKAGDFKQAASAFLEAANLYEQLNNSTLLGYSLAYRAYCLLEREDFVQARFDAVRAVNLLTKQKGPSKETKEMILYAYKVGEQAWSKITTKVPE